MTETYRKTYEMAFFELDEGQPFNRLLSRFFCSYVDFNTTGYLFDLTFNSQVYLKEGKYSMLILEDTPDLNNKFRLLICPRVLLYERPSHFYSVNVLEFTSEKLREWGAEMAKCVEVLYPQRPSLIEPTYLLKEPDA